jgi:hypothetical protein
MVSGYCNGYAGYIPTAEMIRQGGYEVDSFWRKFGHPGRLSEEAEERLVAHFGC